VKESMAVAVRPGSGAFVALLAAILLLEPMGCGSSPKPAESRLGSPTDVSATAGWYAGARGSGNARLVVSGVKERLSFPKTQNVWGSDKIQTSQRQRKDE